MNPQDQERNPKIHQEDVMVRADGCGEESDTDSRGGIHVGRELAEILVSVLAEILSIRDDSKPTCTWVFGLDKGPSHGLVDGC